MTRAVPDDFLSAPANHISVAIDGAIRQATGDDFGNDRASAGPISLGVDVSGALGVRDIDVMRLVLQAGQTYTLALKSGHPAAPVLMLVSGENGLPLHSRSELQHSFTFTPEVSGNFYVSASTDAPAGGSFSFRASTLVDDFGATAGTAGHLPLGGVVAGRLGIGGADRDWFGLTLSAGEYYAITTYSTDLTNTGEFAIGKVFDSRGNMLATSIGTGGVNGNTVGFTPTLSGKYYFEVSSVLPTGAAYTVTAQTSSADDFGDTPETAGRLTEMAPLSGRLSPNDRDSFKLNVVAGNSYVIELVIPASDETRTPVVVQDAAGVGRPLERNGVSTPGAYYTVFEAVTSGDHLVTIDGQGSYATGAYSVTAYSAARDDVGRGVATAGVLDMNAQVRGAIETRMDEDWFRVSLSAGKSYVFELLGSADSGGTLNAIDGSQFRLMLPTGFPASVAGQYDRTSPRVVFTAQETRDYFLLVSGAAKNTGTYTVKATQVIGDATGPTLTSQSLADGAVGVSLTGDFVLSFNESIRVAFATHIWLRDSTGATVALEGAELARGWGTAESKLIIDPVATLRPGTTYTLDLPANSILDHAGNPYSGVSLFSFTTIATTNMASLGNDLLASMGRGGSVAGGAGIDTVVYRETIASYRVVGSDGDATVSHITSTAGDHLSGIERLLFFDGAMALDISGIAGQAYRLYQAALDRVPDKDGLGYWIAQMDSGMTLAKVASQFVGSDEFKALYGAAPTNAQFVDLLYDNVLHRKGDQAGIDFWINSLAAGVQRDDMLASFSESAENQAALVSIIGNGFIYNPYG